MLYKRSVHLSVSEDAGTALAEWEYTGVHFARQGGVCELCDHKNLIYHFEIKNRENEQKLLVGSDCILKFNIPGIDKDGKRLWVSQTQQQIHLQKMQMVKARRERMQRGIPY